MLQQQVENFLKTHGLWGKQICCLAAVSGGIDSMVLLDILIALRQRGGPVVYAAHLNHGLRPEAEADARFVQGFCRAHGVSCTVGISHVNQWRCGKSAEMAAREIRYGFLLDTQRALGASALLLAHHGDDQLETVLLRLARGTSLTGLRGMKGSTDQGILRPLLAVSKEDIRAYAYSQGLAWVEDATNHDEQIPRNRIRARVVPQLRAINPRLNEAVGRLLRNLDRDETYLNEIAYRYAASARREPFGLFWRAQPLEDAIGSRVAVMLLTQIGVNPVTNLQVEALTAFLKRGPGQKKLSLPGGILACWEGESLLLLTGSPTAFEPAALAVPGVVTLPYGRLSAALTSSEGEDTPNRQHMDRRYFPEGVQVRTRREGDLIHPLGAPGRQSLKKAMNARKIPAYARDSWPVVAFEKQILWVPGAGLMEDRLRCRQDTVEYILLEYQREDRRDEPCS